MLLIDSGAMNALARVVKIRDKHRKGLLSLWAFQRLTDSLGKLGVTVHLSVIYREAPAAAGTVALGISDCAVRFAEIEELPEVAAVEAYPLPLADLMQRAERGARCYLLRRKGQIVAFTWCETGGPPRPRLGLQFGPRQAYLFDAHTAPAFRGRNLLPFLRYRLYEELRQRGCHEYLSSTEIFNRPAHRFKQKLGARPLEARLYLRLFGRFERVFVVWRYGTSGL